MNPNQSPPSERPDNESLPKPEVLIEKITPERFRSWYREREIRRNVHNGTPYFNGPSSIQSPTRHNPSKLLQCHRKIFYRQLNAPEEQSDPTGIFWFGSQFEEEIALPFLQNIAAESGTYACNTLWIDFEVDTPESLQIKGATDPAIVTQEGEPLLVTEIKTKSSIEHLETPNRHHKAQAHAYMYGLSQKYDRQVTDAVIIYGSREELVLVAFHVEFDPEFWNETILQWAATHSEYRLHQDLPPAEPELDWECEFCSYRIRCGQADTDHKDIGSVGFLPLYAEYPREKVIEYLQAHDGAKLTPTLAHQYPELVETYGVFDWRCQQCGSAYEWDEIEYSGETGDTPHCPSCLSAERPAPLRGPAPSEQHALNQGDEYG